MNGYRCIDIAQDLFVNRSRLEEQCFALLGHFDEFRFGRQNFGELCPRLFLAIQLFERVQNLEIFGVFFANLDIRRYRGIEVFQVFAINRRHHALDVLCRFDVISVDCRLVHHADEFVPFAQYIGIIEQLFDRLLATQVFFQATGISFISFFVLFAALLIKHRLFVQNVAATFGLDDDPQKLLIGPATTLPRIVRIVNRQQYLSYLLDNRTLAFLEHHF